MKRGYEAMRARKLFGHLTWWAFDSNFISNLQTKKSHKILTKFRKSPVIYRIAPGFPDKEPLCASLSLSSINREGEEETKSDPESQIIYTAEVWCWCQGCSHGHVRYDAALCCPAGVIAIEFKESANCCWC